MKKNIINLIITLILGSIIYYFLLPPINIHSMLFWIFILILIFIYAVFNITLSINDLEAYINKRRVYKPSRKMFFILLVPFFIIIFITLFNILSSPLFNSKSYYERLKVIDGNFEEDISLVDFNHLPLLDKDSSSKLGDRVMGQMTDLVSQFDVSDLYTQINYNNSIIRVTPLEYSGVIKYLTNHKNGVAGYITVDSVNGEAKLVRLDKGMKYMKSAILNENVYRKLRFDYKTLIFDEISFEIDDEGNPYWIAPIIKYTAVGLKKEITGAVILDPITGKSTKYDLKDIPTWVDHVYSSSLVIEQLNDWGKYKNGFINSAFGQKEVVMTTDGYNYLAMNNDIYLYTGITSVIADESNIGFVLTNLRTKETKFYNIAGAEEYSAAASAEGQVQQMNYTSTFPLIINLNGKPTYLMSLKDNAGLVKMYAFVDYTDYQKVVVTPSSLGIEVSAKNYLGEDINKDNLKDKEIEISNIKTAIIDGNTYYYIKSGSDIYKSSIKVAENILPFLSSGDTIKIYYIDSSKEITKIED